MQLSVKGTKEIAAKKRKRRKERQEFFSCRASLADGKSPAEAGWGGGNIKTTS
jgi:hypothetical protein